MDGFLTVGHPAAVAAAHAMLASRVPHAILISGPGAVGKVALALDLAAGLLCTGASGGGRPCRTCRTCRMVEHGNHPDLHWLGPDSLGTQVVIGGPGSKVRGVRDLVTELSLLPVEGGGRVAIVRDVHRAGEDAQSALLKTLEEPLHDTTVILCADDEEVLLPTIRSRCARIRLGTVGVRDVERLLVERGLADAPTAARLARLTGGRAGLAVAYASAGGAEAIRGELTRTLLDLLELGPSRRLASARPLLSRAMELDALLSPPPRPRRRPGVRPADERHRPARCRPGPTARLSRGRPRRAREPTKQLTSHPTSHPTTALRGRSRPRPVVGASCCSWTCGAALRGTWRLPSTERWAPSGTS